MYGFLRFAVLGTFAVAGAALAIAFATQAPPAEKETAEHAVFLPRAETLRLEEPRAVSETVAGSPSPNAPSTWPQNPPSEIQRAGEMAVAGRDSIQGTQPEDAKHSDARLVAPLLDAPGVKMPENPPSMEAPFHPRVAAQFEELGAAARQLRETSDMFKELLSARMAVALAPPAEEKKKAEELPEAAPQVKEPAAAVANEGKAKLPKAEVQRGVGEDKISLNMQDADLRQVLELLSNQGNLNILASKNVTGKVSATLNEVDLNTALDAILKSNGFIARRDGAFLYVGTPGDFDSIDQSRDHVDTRVYRPNYVRAQDLQALVTPMLTKGVGYVTLSPPSQTDIPVDNVKTGGNELAGQDVLVVRDYEAVLVQIDRVVHEVDQQPPQVALEAVILSVKLNSTNKMGVDFEALRDRNNVRLIGGSPLADLAGISTNEGGLKFGFLDSSLAVFLNALETVGDTNVVANPRLMCLNKQRAEILIGNQLGYVSTTVTQNAATQSVEFLEVGTQLRFRPFISSDGMIRLEVHPELSTGTVTVDQGFTLPNKEVTQVTTNIMCPDGSTVVIGGLIREDQEDKRTQIPFMGSLPFVGPAFRSREDVNNRSEVIVLLTPRIVHEPEMGQEGRGVACDFEHRREQMLDRANPLGERFQARRHLALARTAWQCGNRRTAEYHLKMALHYDAMNLEVVKLRDDMAAAGACVGSVSDCRQPWQKLTDHTGSNQEWANPQPREGERSGDEAIPLPSTMGKAGSNRGRGGPESVRPVEPKAPIVSERPKPSSRNVSLSERVDSQVKPASYPSPSPVVSKRVHVE